MSESIRDKIFALRQSGATWNEIGERTSMSPEAARHIYRRGKKSGEIVDDRERFDISGNSTAKHISSVSSTVRTVEDALKKAEVDTDVWEVDRFVVNSWEMGYKDSSKVAHKIPLWQVKVWLKRKVSEAVEHAVSLLAKKLKNHKPKYASRKREPILDGHMLEASLYDVHFGKYAWALESGENSDLEWAEAIYQEAMEDLLRKASGFKITRVLLPVGNDIFHVDNAHNTTVNGTIQDVDGRYAKVYETGFMAVVKGIDHLLGIAPVEVVHVPGNHDRTSSWHLCKELATHYRNVEHVQVDYRPLPRKYVSHGKCLLGFTHGNEEKPTDLPLIMATECPGWSDSSWREIHTGHFHRKKEMKFADVDEFAGVRWRSLPSLSATDAWHFRKGYVNSIRAALGFLWHPEDGLSATVHANVKPMVA